MRLATAIGILAVSAQVQMDNLDLTNEPFLRNMIADLYYVHQQMNFTRVDEEIRRVDVETSLVPSDTEIVSRMVRFSGAAYCPDLTLKFWACTHCVRLLNTQLVSVIYDATFDAKGFVALDHATKSVVVSFRGSYNIRNWFTDFNYKLKDLDVGDGTPGIQVHTGFLEQSTAMNVQIAPIVKPLLAKYGYSLTVTGHSLGAAVATLTTVNLKNQLNLPWARINLVTFGEPRVGNPAFATWYNRMNPGQIRVVNNRDMVPHVPPMPMGFVHRKREILLSGLFMRSCEGGVFEDPTCALALAPLLSAKDHLFYWDVIFGLTC